MNKELPFNVRPMLALRETISAYLEGLAFTWCSRYHTSKCEQWYITIRFTQEECIVRLHENTHNKFIEKVTVATTQELIKILDMLRRNDYGPAITRHRLTILHALREDEA